jgi:two-component system chemotaxis response regulator CheB
MLPEILSRAGPLQATHPIDGEEFWPAHIYVAPPDHHLLLEPGGQMRLTRGARENMHRPAADPLFRSAARHYGPRVIGVVLTGGMYDGTAGLMAIRAAGGLAVAQDPKDAAVAAMPQHATDIAGVDYTVTAAELAELLVKLVGEPGIVDPGARTMDPIEHMPTIVEQTMDRQVKNERLGEVSVFSCPECGGTLWQVDETGLIQFRCHVGHVYNGEALLDEQSEALEAALWTSVRAFREKSILARQLAVRERERGNHQTADRFSEQAEQAQRYASLILKHVLNGGEEESPGPGK